MSSKSLTREALAPRPFNTRASVPNDVNYLGPITVGGQQFGLYRTPSLTIWRNGDPQNIDKATLKKAYAALTGDTRPNVRPSDVRQVVLYALQVEWYLKRDPKGLPETVNVNYRRACRVALENETTKGKGANGATLYDALEPKKVRKKRALPVGPSLRSIIEDGLAAGKEWDEIEAECLTFKPDWYTNIPDDDEAGRKRRAVFLCYRWRLRGAGKAEK